jgi:sister-chromatid-cohesion protein PDS5
METVLRRGSLHIINQSSIPTLVKRVQRGDPSGDGHGTSQAQQTANQAFTLLTYAAKHCPAVYKPHVSELTKAFGDERNPRLVEICLQALAGAVQWDNSLYPSDE